MDLYRHKYIWLHGFMCVIGWEPEELIKYINEWNASRLWKYGMSFWEWLKYETDETVYGFDVLWNEGNPHMSKLPTIRS